jgi:amino acid transporter
MSLPSPSTTPAALPDRLERTLGLWAAIGVVIGTTIGSGIFRTPASIAARVPDPAAMLALWVVGGAMALAGALSIAELAAAFPHAGGPYVYLREGWGRLAGFLFGWSQLTLIRAASLGAIASVFGEYFLRSFGFDPAVYPRTADYVAAAAVIFATGANVIGARLGAAITGLSTLGKYGGLVLIVGSAAIFGGDHGASASHFTTSAPVAPGLFGLALISALWAYDGFADLSFAAGEVQRPERNLPRALVLGTAAVVVIYLLANVAYLYVSPIERVAQSRLIAADTMVAIFGRVGEALVSVIVMISTFGALNGSMLLAPRIFFALADDGLFFRGIAAVHPRYGTPYVAVILTGGLGVAMVLTQTFEQLSDTFVLASWPFYALGVAAVYVLRRSRPDMPRPYRTWGYPLVPAIFLAGAIYLTVNAVITDPLWTGVVFGLVLLGVPVYLVRFKGSRRTA